MNTHSVLLSSIVLAAGTQLACTLESGGGPGPVADTRAPAVEWHRGYGTDYEEGVHEGAQTSDGGYIGVGDTREGESRYTDMLIVKVDSDGSLEWQRTIGTSNQYDFGICVAEVPGGYVVGGALYSSGNQQRALAKLDSGGNVLWQNVYPNAGNGAIRGIDVTSDGGLVATGYTDCPEEGFVFVADEGEGFILKTDPDGDTQWENTLSAAQGTKVREDTNSGGFAVCSTVWEFNGEDHMDICLIRTDGRGNEISSMTYGGSGNDLCFDEYCLSYSITVLSFHNTGGLMITYRLNKPGLWKSA